MSERSIQQWLHTPPGRYLITREQAFFDEVVADIFGYNAVQLGLTEVDLLRNSRIPCRIQAGFGPGCQVKLDLHALPFASQSVDLLLLPHQLEFSRSPHAVLREAERVLMPEGQIIITGFNPFSLWGLARLHPKLRQHYPWSGDFISLLRLKDWLALLDFEIVQGKLYGYVPPLQSRIWLERLQVMDQAGDRWWPIGGGAYFLVARKRVPGLRLIRPGWAEQKLAGRLRAVKPIIQRHNSSPEEP